MDAATEERLAALEIKVATQEAQIDGLLGALADMSAAHIVLHKDLRLISFLSEGFKSDRKNWEQGGTTRISAAFFGDRCDLVGRLLEQVSYSQVFERYWHRSFFRRREEREIASLKKLREKVKEKLN
jgi:uncharacterized coiled-coil protein SlyX